MSDGNERATYSAASVAIWSSVVLSVVYIFAFVYAAQNLGGDASMVYWFLAVISAIGAFATTVAKIIVDVAWMMLRKKELLDKAKRK